MKVLVKYKNASIPNEAPKFNRRKIVVIQNNSEVFLDSCEGIDRLVKEELNHPCNVKVCKNEDCVFYKIDGCIKLWKTSLSQARV